MTHADTHWSGCWRVHPDCERPATDGDWPDNRVATFRPRRTDDLQVDDVSIGQTLEWRFMGTMDEGPYAGQRIWIPEDRNIRCGWVPDEDLEDVQPHGIPDGGGDG